MAKKGESKKPAKIPPKPKTSRKKKNKPKATQSENSNWRQWIDILSKGSFFGLAVTYITGFLVVTVHFSKIGLPPPLSTSKYLIAGFFPLLTLVLVWLAFRIIKKYWKAKTYLEKAHNYITGIYLFLIMYVGLYILGVYLSGTTSTQPTETISPYIIGGIIIGPLIISGILALVFWLRKKRIPLFVRILATISLLFFLLFGIYGISGIGTVIWLILTPFVVKTILRPKVDAPDKPLVPIAIVIIWLGVYGLLVYPNVPRLFGGGQTNEVIIWSQTHPLYPNTPLYPDFLEAELIDKTGNEYLLRIEDSLGEQHIVEISKDKVESVIYLTPKQIKTRQAKADSLKEVEKDTTTTDTLFPAPDSS